MTRNGFSKRFRSSRLRQTFALLAFLTLGCADLPQCTPPREHVVELFSWWVEAGEKEAITDLALLHANTQAARGRPTFVVQTTVGSAAQASYYLWERRAPNALPDVFQANIGKELRRRAVTWISKVNEALDASPDNIFWTDLTHEASTSGYLYCIPLDIHRVNTLFFNQTALQELGVDLSGLQTIGGFEKICEDLESRTGKLPIALGTRDSAWTLSALVHENILPTDISADAYRSFWSGSGGTYDWNKLKPSYSRLIAWVKRWVNADYATTHWKTAAERLFFSKDDPHRAFFFVMGDWAQAEFKTAGNRLNSQDVIASVPFPSSDAGTAAPFVYTSDCLALPRNAPHSGDGLELLRTAASVEGQLTFSSKKGSIPARHDVGEEVIRRELGERASAVRHEFDEAEEAKNLLLAVSGYTTYDELAGLDEQLLLMLEEAQKPADPSNPGQTLESALKLMSDFWAANFKKLGPD